MVRVFSRACTLSLVHSKLGSGWVTILLVRKMSQICFDPIDNFVRQFESDPLVWPGPLEIRVKLGYYVIGLKKIEPNLSRPNIDSPKLPILVSHYLISGLKFKIWEYRCVIW